MHSRGQLRQLTCNLLENEGSSAQQVQAMERFRFLPWYRGNLCHRSFIALLLGRASLMGSVIKKRRKRMAKKKHKKLLKKTRIQRRNAKQQLQQLLQQQALRTEHHKLAINSSDEILHTIYVNPGGFDSIWVFVWGDKDLLWCFLTLINRTESSLAGKGNQR